MTMALSPWPTSVTHPLQDPPPHPVDPADSRISMGPIQQPGNRRTPKTKGWPAMRGQPCRWTASASTTLTDPRRPTPRSWCLGGRFFRRCWPKTLLLRMGVGLWTLPATPMRRTSATSLSGGLRWDVTWRVLATVPAILLPERKWLLSWFVPWVWILLCRIWVCIPMFQRELGIQRLLKRWARLV